MKVVFAGTPAFAAAHLQALIDRPAGGADSGHEVIAVITQPDRPGKRGRKLVPSPVKVLAETAGIPVLQPERLRVADLETLTFDVMIVVAYGQILKPAVLAYPPRGCINVHASILPRWRGAAPVQRAIQAGDTESGVTLIQMDEGLDTGDMLMKTHVAIDDRETAGSLFEKLTEAGPQTLIATLDALESGEGLAAEPQDDSRSNYASKITKEEAHIDWSGDALSIDRNVRAFNPDPIAWSLLPETESGKSLRVKIHEGRPVTASGDNPGEILDVTRQGVLVACGQGSYLIERIQLPVGKGSVLGGADILNGWQDQLHTGVRFS